MLKKKELEVSIHCEGPFAPFVYRKLFRFNDSSKKHTVLPPLYISIDNLETQDDKVELQHVTYSDTLHATRTLEIKRAKTLYRAFEYVINQARIDLDQIGYDPLGDILIVTATPTENKPNHYNFGWSFIG